MNKNILIFVFLGLGLLTVGLIPVLQVTVFKEFEKTYSKVVSDLLKNEAKMLSNQVHNDILNGNTRFVRAQLENSLSKSGFTSFRIVDAKGILIEDSEPSRHLGDSSYKIEIMFSEAGPLWGTIEFFANPSLFDDVKTKFQDIQIMILIVSVSLFFLAGFFINYLLGYSSIQISRFVDRNPTANLKMTLLEKLFWSDLIAKIKSRSEHLASVVSKAVILEEKAAFAEMSRQFAHDIRSPISSLTLLAYNLDQENVLDRKPVIKEACERIVGISKELLSKTRSNNLKITEVDAKFFFENLAIEKRAEFGINAQLAININSNVKNIKIPEIWMRRVVSNLINNSVEALGEKDKAEWNILMEVDAFNNQLNIRIHDNGTGLSPSVIENAHEEIFTTKPEGNGLGTFDAKKLAAYMSGHFDLTPNFLGGATSSLVLTIQ